jgi:hypothetical protein
MVISASTSTGVATGGEGAVPDNAMGEKKDDREVNLPVV